MPGAEEVQPSNLRIWVWAYLQGVHPVGAGECPELLARAIALARGEAVGAVSRRERQRAEILRAARSGLGARRAGVLVREHLQEFPTDEVALAVEEELARR